jgi:myo-inositol-1(or 4)-monophosphatase
VLQHPEEVDGPLLAELAEVAMEAATSAARILHTGFGQARLSVSTKSSSTDMVSEMDRGAEAAVVEVLVARRFDDGLLGEEGAAREGTTGIRWVVDPLDGTTNYLFDIPIYGVSVAAEVDDTPVVGVVIDPEHDEVWSAQRGRGAWCNGKQLSVAKGRSNLSTALVATGFGYGRNRRKWQAGLLAAILPAVRDIRRNGAASLDLCWVAAGRFDAYFEWGLHPWDMSAGTLICTEAGGVVQKLAETIVASTVELAEPLRALLNEAGATEALGSD